MELLDLFPTTVCGVQLKSFNAQTMLDCMTSTNFLRATVFRDGDSDGEFTENQAILDAPKFLDVRTEIEAITLQYAHSLGHVVQGVQIINSWANLIRDGDQLHPHWHPNSYISGCFYITDGASIEFMRPNFMDILFGVEPSVELNNENPRTFKSFFIDPKPGMLLLFPSRLQHKVNPQKGNDRYSIAFNTMPLGNFGRATMQMTVPRF